MSAASSARIETLNKENYDTWKIQMEALLIKNDAWSFVNGESECPALNPTVEASVTAVKNWKKGDSKAKSDIILSINPSELKQIKNCTTSNDVWMKLQSIYQSKGPARKANLLKQLTLQRMSENGDVREHLNKFFDAVDKLNEMEVEINPDLLAIMLLYSLPPSFENFRCAIESRDTLPPPETLRVKIVEEHDARKTDTCSENTNAMFVNKSFKKLRNFRKPANERTSEKSQHDASNSGNGETFKYRCHKCRKIGHKAINCKNAMNKDTQFAKCAENENICFGAGIVNKNSEWCLDSGATSHLCKDIEKFSHVMNYSKEKLNLANNSSAEVKAKGTVSIKTNVNGNSKEISLINTLFVPDLRTNLLSVSKITDSNFEVLFKKNCAIIFDLKGNIKLTAERVNNLYHVSSIDESARVSTEFAGAASEPSETEKWHRTLGHLNIKDLKEAQVKGTVNGIQIKSFDEHFECIVCNLGKITRKSFPKNSDRMTSMWTRLLVLSLVIMLALTLTHAQDGDVISSRPIRPEYFQNAQEVKNYVKQLKAFYSKSGTRFGKRFSPPGPPAHFSSGPAIPRDIEYIYNLIDNYKNNY